MAKMRYAFKYKCRLCNEEFESGSTNNYETAVEDIALRVSANYRMIYPHHCNENDIGIADFIGVKGE